MVPEAGMHLSDMRKFSSPCRGSKPGPSSSYFIGLRGRSSHKAEKPCKATVDSLYCTINIGGGHQIKDVR